MIGSGVAKDLAPSQRVPMQKASWNSPLAIFFLGFLLLLFANGCGGGGGGGGDSPPASSGDNPTPTATSTSSSTTTGTDTTTEKQFVLNRMRDWYLWYDQIPSNLDIASYSSAEAVLEATRYKTRDKWSYIETAKAATAQLNTGEFTGIGIRTSQDASGNLWVNEVFANSPAKAAGVIRGDRIVSINGKSIAEINAAKGWDTAYGASTAGVQVDLVLARSASSETLSLSLVKGTFIVDAVPVNRVLSQNNTFIGYLVYDSFTSASYISLVKAFNTFQAAGVSEMILDLRYNGGGLVDVAAYLASLMRNASSKDVFAKLQYNKNHSSSNYNLNYSTLTNNLNLSQVFFITSSATCSASEMLIQGLKPYVTVVPIGTTTCGKPVGMDVVTFSDKVLAAISFTIVNANGEGDYYNGLTPVCTANDDLTHSLGDVAESSLSTALSYLANKTCPATATQRQIPGQILTLWPKGSGDQGRDGLW
ncbi:MAG: PDZ domain-containing protein [Magnetococcales bacterium]|nr:PDZ domain-containing protein [Magnetococcales bacterium]